MGKDDETISVYDARAAEYAKLVGTDTPSDDLVGFIADIPADGHVLDLGCGPAASSAHMRSAGLRPDPVDASEGMVTIANDTFDIGARQATFEDIAGTAIYDGVWANFSLLHAARDDLPRYLLALSNALKPNGHFHIGMKTGDGAERDGIGRMYTYVSVPELHALLRGAGLRVTATREGREKGMAGTLDPFVICRAVKDA